MSGKYLTVQEFAEKAHVSKQAIYDASSRGKKLYPYTIRRNGRKVIRVDALGYYLGNAAEDPETGTETEAAPDPENKMVSLLLERLQVADDQLRAKDQQINAQSEQIKDLTEAVKAAQATQYRLQEQLALLTGDGGFSEGSQADDPQQGAAAPEMATERHPQAAQQQGDATGSPEGSQRGFRAWLRRLLS